MSDGPVKSWQTHSEYATDEVRMGDDLVNRLRKGDPFGGVMQRAAARISALEAALAKADELAEATWRGPSNRYIVEAREAYRQSRDATT